MKLKEICEINPKTREIDDDTEVSFVSMPSVTEDGKIDTSGIRSYQDVKKGYTVFQEGDVLFAKITPCMENGKGAIAYGLMNGIGCGSSEFHVLRPNKGVVTAEWIYYLTAWEWFRNEAEKHMTGSAGQKRVPKAYLENYVVNVPSLEEQKKQTKVLVQLQHIIDDRKKELICLDDIIKARFIELFGDPKYNKSNLVKIGEIGALTSGGTPSRAKPEYFEGDIRWYSAGELNSLYLPDSVEHISEMALRQSSAKLFNKGTLMIGMYDTAAFKMGILTESSSSNQACANLNPKQGYNIVWLYYLFDIMKPIFLQERQGVRQKNLSLSKIKEFEVPFAPFELQEQFAAFVEQTDKSKFIVQKSLEETQKLFDSLMQKYFG